MTTLTICQFYENHQFSCRCKLNYIHTFTVKPYGVLQVQNT
jgi:hypothetical protein